MTLEQVEIFLKENDNHRFTYTNILDHAAARQPCWYLKDHHLHNIHDVAKELTDKGYTCEYLCAENGVSHRYKVSGWTIK